MYADTINVGCYPAVSRILGEHKEVLDSLGDFRAALNLNRPKAELTRLLAAFVDTVGKHFASEEELMRTNGYPGLKGHAVEHKRLLDQIQSVQDEFNAGEIGPCGALTVYVEVWVMQHVERMDKQLIEYLNETAGAGAGRPANLQSS